MELRGILCFYAVVLLCGLCRAGPAGKEFALSFMQNYKPGNNGGASRFMVEVSSPLGAVLSTTVKVTALGKVYEKTLQPGAGEALQLPDEVEIIGSTRSKQTVRIEADQDILVLSLNFKTYSADTSVIYPVKDWGTEYYIYTPQLGPPDAFKEFSITNQGIQNSVEIQVMGAVTFQGQHYEKGNKLTIDLEPFESVQIQSKEDLTGSKISAKQPVAVFTGHSCTWYFSDCNHVYEQLLPVSSWGTAFSVASLAYTQPTFRFDTVIIQASQKTQVKINTQDGAGSPKSMVPGESLYINMPYPNSLQITADKGIQVLYEFNGGANQNKVLNDPFLMTILSTDRFATSYTMGGQVGFTNEAIIVARTSDVGKLTLDKTPISKDLQWTQVAKSEYSWTQFSYGSSPGFNQVAHPDSPFALYSFGVSKENGYGSPALGNPSASAGTCWVMGDPHYRTFDGDYYNFMGNCTYIMAKNCHPDSIHPAFEIQAENKHLGSSKATSVNKVIITVYGATIAIVRHESGLVRISDSLWYLPISLANGRVTLRQSGLSVVMETDFGLSVQYDWEQYMMVKIPASFMGKMCGMCGNFNGKKDDDLTTPSGSLAGNIAALGKSWRVPGLPGEAYCTDDCTGQCESCKGESWFGHLEAKAFCHLATLLTDGPLRDCKSLIDPKVFYENCLLDYCMGKGYKILFCRAAQIYTDACQRAGIHVHDWRRLVGCSTPTCPANSYFETCACPATCENPIPSADCKINCVEACTCNDGLLWSGNKCVPKNQCGCMYSNGAEKHYLQNGESIWTDKTCSSKCTCKSGQIVCERSSCQTGSECSIVDGIRGCHPISHGICNIYGDPHYNTFDNKTYDFQGTCTYTAAQGCHLEGTHLTPFSVIVENEKWYEAQVNPTVSVAKVVVVEVYGMILVLRRNQLHQIMVNGILTNIPISLDDGKVKVQQEGYQNVILTDFGLVVTYDMDYHITITVPSSYHGKTCGMCGNFNGNKNDDFLLPDGKEAKDNKVFGAAWKVPVPGVVCDDGCSGDVCPKCPENKKLVFEKDCRIITSQQGPFAACHNIINPESYFRDCVYDVCMGDGDHKMLCTSIAAYMTDCQNFGITVKNWRTPTFCPLTCPANSHYETCAEECDVPCPGLTEIVKCNIQTCYEGCMCDSGFFNNGTGCVKADQCSCYENGHTYKIGESVLTKNCQEQLTCLPSGVIKHEPKTCSTNEECVIKNGVLGCYPKPNTSAGTCWVMGDPHYRTFDGDYYNFMGNCTYIMAKNCHPDKDHPEFEVQTMNERFGSTKATYVSEVIIKVYGQTVTIVQHETGLVRMSESLWYLPISLANGRVTLRQSGLSVVMETDFGLSVQYDWEQYMVVKIPASFMGKMCGMCGNFNGKKGDDLTTPSGSLAANIAALGKSWRVPGLPGEAYCTDDCTGQCESCKGESWFGRLQAKGFCHLVTILTDGPLRDCKSLIDPKIFYDNCLLDYCMGKGYKNFLCKTAQIYTDACQRSGIHVINWRKLIDCPTPTCPANSHFETCACPATCENPIPSADCKSNCVEACTCNDGLLWSGNKCVPKNQCGCMYSNGAEKHYLQNGESIWTDKTCSSKCTCKSGQIVCERSSCQTGSECSIVDGIRGCHPITHGICNIYGDPHYNTFDNKTYDFQGTCTYTAAQGCHLEGTHLTPFSVIVENEKWYEAQVNPTVSVAKVVVVEVYGMILVLRRNQLHQIMVNGILTNIPISLDDGKVKVQQEGYQNVILTDFGLVVTYDMDYHITITVPSSYHGKTCGMCGNFNGNKNDDLLLPDGKEAKDNKVFGAAWKVPVPGVVCDDGCSGDVCPKCPENKKLVFEKDCRIITNQQGPFAACHNIINPESYFRDCVYDVCMGDGDHKMLCTSIAAYMTDCQNFGITVKNWRTPTFCPLTCPANSHYETCAEECDVPCPGLTEIVKCNIQTCYEGCMCDSGFFNNGTGCVKADQCSCYENGHTYKIGESVLTKNCQEQLTCLPSGVIKHEPKTCSTNEECVIKNGVLGCYPKPNTSAGTCWVMGDPHYRTFDGDYYNFMGNCTYIMAKNCHPDKDHPEFEVQTMNERFGSTKATYVSEVIIKVYGQTVTIVQHETGLVRISDSLWYLPVSLANGRVTLWQSGLSVVMETDFGLSVQYDWEQYMVVKIPASFMGKMCGMCGNFNGKKGDDLTTPSGSLAGNIAALGKSWRVPGLPGEAYCTDDCTGQCNACKGESWFGHLEAKAFCHLATVLTDGPLRDCKSLIDPKVFYDNCLFDYCMGKGYKNFLCKTAQIYTDACQRAGVHVHDWRNIIGCPAPKCPANSHFESCACPATCENPTPSPDCKATCVASCTCNAGFLWSGNKCVPSNQCGCLYSTGDEKRYLQAGESIRTGDSCSNKCTCNPTNGQVMCENEPCPKGTACTVSNGIRDCHAVSHAICNIYGDPHYHTFDNSTYDFQGTCTYTAAQSCHIEGTALIPFSVIVENEKWYEAQVNPTVSVAKVVVVEVYGMILVLRRYQLHQIMVNGVLINIPISLDDGKLKVQQVGNQNVITTDFGLIVTYDMVYHVTITVPSSYRGKTCGMCGNFNGNKNDDFLLPDGKEAKDKKVFGAAWKVPVPGVVCDDGCSGDVCPKCPENKKLVIEKDCRIITNQEGPFAACHNIINPESYFRDCVYDVCMGDGDHKILCHSIAAYMTNCQNFGVSVKNWRTPTFCPLKCPANSHYENCAGSCDTPCPGLTEVVNCNLQTCFEGCVCDAGFFTNGSGCVKVDQCSCYENGVTYKIGESIITQDCEERLTCLSSGIVKHESMKCNSDEVCMVKNDVRGCYPRQCQFIAGGSFTLFNGTAWTITSLGAFDFVQVCDSAVALNWFRVVVQLQTTTTGVFKAMAVNVFIEDVLITVNSQQEIWINGRKVSMASLGKKQIFIKIIDQTVIIEKESAFSLTYSQTQEITIIVSEEMIDKVCGACGKLHGTITGESIQQYMNQNRAPDYPSCT